MSHSFTRCYFHATFSTKGRERVIAPEFRQDLWSYMGGIARVHAMEALAVGGTSDHSHVLFSLASSLPISKAVQLIKGGSSKWVNDNRVAMRTFEWQRGYAAFSIGRSQIDTTIAYIHNQEAHHRVRSFEEEYLEFLRRHGFENEPYIWD